MNILYEDKDILLIHKPAGIATQTRKIGEKDIFSEAKNHVKGGYIGIINRLDQPVEGIVLLAKSSKTAAYLTDELTSHNIEKYYRARIYRGEVDITPANEKVLLTDYMVKEAAGNCSRIADKNEKDAKKAQLEYRVTEVNDCEATLDIHLITGRHHQIRLQMSNAGLPLLGDKKYGSEASIEYSVKKGYSNVALCAYRLKFVHPATKKEVSFEI